MIPWVYFIYHALYHGSIYQVYVYQGFIYGYLNRLITDF